jgi:hypothetical protein
MKAVPLWIYNGYKDALKTEKKRLDDLRKEKLFGLVPEVLNSIERLESTIKNIETIVYKWN